jgi:hypothetical protein
MKKFLNITKLLGVVVILAVIGYIVIENYSFIFSRVVTGQVVSVERVNTQMVLSTNSDNTPPPQMFSFAVAIEDEKTHEIVVASSEDRQWAAVEKGHCATARFYPYPFWVLDKSGTYNNARLLHLLKNCDKKTE